MTRCSRDGLDASPLGAAASAKSSPRSMDMPLLASAAAAAFLLTRFGLQQCGNSQPCRRCTLSPSQCSVAHA